MVVLHIEDDENDALFIERALAQVEGVQFLHVSSGEEALNYLQGRGTYKDREKYPLPDVVLTDLKMLGYTGFDVLKWVQKQRLLRHVHRAVVSSSPIEEDRERAKESGAEAYFVKDTRYTDVCRWLRRLRAGENAES